MAIVQSQTTPGLEPYPVHPLARAISQYAQYTATRAEAQKQREAERKAEEERQLRTKQVETSIKQQQAAIRLSQFQLGVAKATQDVWQKQQDAPLGAIIGEHPDSDVLAFLDKWGYNRETKVGDVQPLHMQALGTLIATKADPERRLAYFTNMTQAVKGLTFNQIEELANNPDSVIGQGLMAYGSEIYPLVAGAYKDKLQQATMAAIGVATSTEILQTLAFHYEEVQRKHAEMERIQKWQKTHPDEITQKKLDEATAAYDAAVGAYNTIRDSVVRATGDLTVRGILLKMLSHENIPNLLDSKGNLRDNLLSPLQKKAEELAIEVTEFNLANARRGGRGGGWGGGGGGGRRQPNYSEGDITRNLNLAENALNRGDLGGAFNIILETIRGIDVSPNAIGSIIQMATGLSTDELIEKNKSGEPYSLSAEGLGQAIALLRTRPPQEVTPSEELEGELKPRAPSAGGGTSSAATQKAR